MRQKSVSASDPGDAPKKEAISPQDIEKRYLLPAEVVTKFSIPRYRVFEGIRLGHFRSILLKRGHSTRNLRLVDIQSLEEFLARHETMPKTTQNPK